MTRKEKKLYEQMRQYQPPDVEAEKYFEMQKKAQEEIDTIKKAWKRAESIRTLSAKSKDSDTKKDVSEDAKVAAKPAAQKKEEPEQLSLFNLGA